MPSSAKRDDWDTDATWSEKRKWSSQSHPVSSLRWLTTDEEAHVDIVMDGEMDWAG